MNPLKASLRNSVFLSSFTLTISPEDLHSIFSNVEVRSVKVIRVLARGLLGLQLNQVLLRVHTTILGEFEMLLDKWPVIEQIGSTFLRKVHIDYVGFNTCNYINFLHQAADFRVYGI